VLPHPAVIEQIRQRPNAIERGVPG